MDVPERKKHQTPESFYSDAKIHKYEIEDATIAVRVFGQGPAIALIHGYPVHGYTWRKLLPQLASHYTCYVIDLPGFGDSDWTSHTDFSFTAQAYRLDILFKSLGLTDFALIAHNTGATLARLVALLQPDSVKKLVIINTEIPNHRPPWIPFYQFCAKLPFSNIVFRTLLKSPLFLRSSLGLGQFYENTKLFDIQSNVSPYITPLVTSTKKLQGMLYYLIGIEWPVVDSLFSRHKDIQADMLLLWGEADKTFPVDQAEQMCSQFTCHYNFVRIRNASLMPHEEKPDEILEYLIPFLSGLA